jgi:hypothetical protein
MRAKFSLQSSSSTSGCFLIFSTVVKTISRRTEMQKQTNSNWQKQFLIAAMVTVIFIFAGNLTAFAQGIYKVGDRVECEVTGNLPGKYWMKGTIMPFQKGDFGLGIEPDGSWFRVKADANRVEYPCKPEHIRPIAGAKASQKENRVEETEEINQAAKEAKDDTSADVDFLECPIEQKQVSKGAGPNVELFKKIIRCKKGEKAVEKGDEGAVKVDITAIQIGTSRPWSYSQDIGNVKPGTVVYPVKATYTVKTLYRTATEVEENWIRILNFYVNAFGEWQIGSEEPVKSPKIKRIPKN